MYMYCMYSDQMFFFYLQKCCSNMVLYRVSKMFIYLHKFCSIMVLYRVSKCFIFTCTNSVLAYYCTGCPNVLYIPTQILFNLVLYRMSKCFIFTCTNSVLSWYRTWWPNVLYLPALILFIHVFVHGVQMFYIYLHKFCSNMVLFRVAKCFIFTCTNSFLEWNCTGCPNV